MADLYKEPVPFDGEPMRLLAQDVITGAWLSPNELPANDVEITNTRSGPSVISGKFEPESEEIRELGLTPWGTWIHAEIDGVIQASGILQPGSLEDETLTFTAEGCSTYPHGMIYLGTYSQIGVDAGDVIREIWRHLQSFEHGNIGVTIEGTTGYLLGTPKVKDDTESGPYLLAWYNVVDCGDEIKKLCEQAKVDFFEIDDWNADRTNVTHKIVLKDGTVTRKRDDLIFVVGDNVVDQPTMPAYTDYANSVVSSGAGEGSKRVQAVATKVIPGTLRRMAAIDDSTVTKKDRAQALADIELRKRLGLDRFEQITVKANDENAKYGEYATGDAILVQADMPYLGEQKLWHEIREIKYSAATEDVTIGLDRITTL